MNFRKYGKLGHLLRKTASNWNDHNAFRLSAALSYYTVFSLGPILLLAVAVAGFVFGKEAANGELTEQLRGLMGRQGAEAVQAVLAGMKNNYSNFLASLVSILILLFGATGVFTELKSALNLIWDAKPVQNVSGFRVLVKDRLLSFALVAAVGFLLLVSLALSTILSALSKFMTEAFPAPPLLFQFIAFGFSFAMITVLFALMYKVLPDVILEWKDVWIGAAITSLLFSLGKQVIGLYLGQSSVTSAYGASASIVVLLLWAYYSSLILFFGAEFTYVYAHEWGSRTNREENSQPKV